MQQEACHVRRKGPHRSRAEAGCRHGPPRFIATLEFGSVRVAGGGHAGLLRRARLAHAGAVAGVAGLQGICNPSAPRPGHVYDPGHEYGEGLDHGPHLPQDGVRLYRFDREGFLMPPGSFHSGSSTWFSKPCAGPGTCVCREPDLQFPSRLGEDLGLLTQGGEPRKLVVPDLAVMPPSWTLVEARERTVQERIIRGRGRPRPGTVVEGSHPLPKPRT